MRPNDYPFNLNHLYDCWKQAVREHSVRRSGSDIDPAVVRSWQRCLKQLDPDSPPLFERVDNNAIELARSANQELIDDALSHLEDCHQYMESTKSVLLLCDGQARCLHRIGDHDMLTHTEALGIRPGCRWNESTAGTNAVALCLENVMPTQVIGPEHFFTPLHSLATSAAPIHNLKGSLIGVVALITPVQDATPHALSMMMTVSRAIENSLQAQHYLNEANARLIELNTIMSSITDGIIAWDGSGKVVHINAKAETMLHLGNAVQGEWIGTILRLPEVIRDAWENDRVVRDIETTIGSGLRNISALASLIPYHPDSSAERGFLLILRSIADVRRLINRQTGSRANVHFSDIPAISSAMRRVVKQAKAAGQSSAPVLIRGEEGVGRMQLAQAIHNDSKRSRHPFMAINCNAIPTELMLSEFLGHGDSGRSSARPSKFELADGGTLLLDRVETLSMQMQSALVHLIENGTVMRLQSDQPIPVDVRIIATTSSDIEKMVAEGSFSRRLYYAFFIFSIVVPPLRERPDDLAHVVSRSCERLSQQRNKPLHVGDEALQILTRYFWPGNLRELENALEQAAGQCEDGIISPDDLPEAVHSGRLFEALQARSSQVLSASEAEREAIRRAGWVTGGRVGQMAVMLGLSRTTLWRRMKNMNLSPEEFRQ